MKRWWGVRHIRWFYLRYRLLKWWEEFGRYHFGHINEADFDYLNAVWRGEK